jgi:hypothetical protein
MTGETLPASIGPSFAAEEAREQRVAPEPTFEESRYGKHAR